MSGLDQILSQPGFGESGTLALSSLPLALLVAYGGGVLASLTPCVYPMIPITVGVITGLGNARAPRTQGHWKRILTRALIYIGGMCVVYASLGVAAGLTGRVFGTLTQTSGWYLFLGVVIALSALAMLEVFTFDPLAWWHHVRSRLGFTSETTHSASEMTAWGAFGLGATSGLVAAPCTTPVMTGILGYIARTQSVGVGLAMMLAFSLGLATLLFAIAIFAGTVQVLPRSGNWMVFIKKSGGWILLGFSMYLFFTAGKLHGGLL